MLIIVLIYTQSRVNIQLQKQRGTPQIKEDNKMMKLGEEKMLARGTMSAWGHEIERVWL